MNTETSLTSLTTDMYVILTGKSPVCVGRYSSMSEAAEVGDGADKPYVVVCDAADIEAQLKRNEMVVLYNDLTGAELKKFATKSAGAERLMVALDDAELVKPVAVTITSNKPVEKKRTRKAAMLEYLEKNKQITKDELRELFGEFGPVSEATLTAALYKYPKQAGLHIERDGDVYHVLA